MIKHLYIFCFLVLLVFSCRLGKKAAEDDPAVIECKRKAIREFEVAEDEMYKKKYYSARRYYLQVLTYDCLDGMKWGHKRKRKPLKEFINLRIIQIDTLVQRERREKVKRCNWLLREADTSYVRGKYENSRGLYREYLLSECCPAKDKVMMNVKIAKVDSLIKAKDSVAKEKHCTHMKEESERLYEQKNYQRARDYYEYYEYWACPVKDSVSFKSKIRELDSLIKLEKN